MRWYSASTGNHQGLIIDEETGANVAVCYDKANAPLITAAPKLLEACKDGVKFLDSLLAGNGMTENQLRALSENRMAYRRILEAAIEQAKIE